MRGYFNLIAIAAMFAGRFGRARMSNDDTYTPPPPKKISRKTAIKLSNQKKPGRK